MTKVADGALDVVNHIGIRVLRSETVIDGKDRVAGWREKVRAISFAAALAIAALIAAAVDDDGDGMNARPCRGVIVHGEVLAVGLAIDQPLLRRLARIRGISWQQKRGGKDPFRFGGHS